MYTRRDGRLFDFHEQLKANALFLDEIVTSEIPKEVVNKTLTKVLTSPKIDRQTIISLIAYINKEHPKMQLKDAAIPFLAQILVDALEINKNIFTLEKWRTTDLINRFNQGKVEIKPNTLWEAIKNKRTADYISIWIRDTLQINPKPDSTVNNLDFH